MKKKNWNKILLIIFTIIFVFFLVYNTIQEIKQLGQFYWEIDAAFSLLGLWALYSLRHKIRLHPFHYFLFGFFLSTHLLGAFRAYDMDFGMIEYDMVMHWFAGLVAALLFFRGFNLKGKVKKEWPKYLLIAILILGLSTFHEIIEGLGAILIGDGGGVLGFGPGDWGEFDLQKDYVANVIGVLCGILPYVWYRKYKNA